MDVIDLTNSTFTMSSVGAVQQNVSASVCFRQAMAMCHLADNDEDDGGDNGDCNHNFWTDDDSDGSECSQCARRTSVTSVGSATSADGQTTHQSDNSSCQHNARLSRRRASVADPTATRKEISLPSRNQKSHGRKKTCAHRNEVRVQWADEKNEALVRENPRKRYERRPSRKMSDPIKPILKQSSFDADK